MINSPEVKKIYASLQKQLFGLIPEKWEKIYLYASVQEKTLHLETGELYFYYFPKGILKKNPVNVYEIPSRFNIDEESYIKLVERLYNTIKKLRDLYKKENVRLWSNITIRIVNFKFQIDFNYENLEKSKYSNTERHIVWKYKNLELPIESFTRKERKLIDEYINSEVLDLNITESYEESIYKRPIKNIIEYNNERTQESYIQEKKPKEEKKNSQYTYITKNKKIYEKRNKAKNEEESYIKQIENQRTAVKSQILSHL